MIFMEFHVFHGSEPPYGYAGAASRRERLAEQVAGQCSQERGERV